MPPIQLTVINHASVLLEFGDLRLLTDPWFFGECFAGGWGLREENRDALRHVDEATHLWISHFHPDHFHVPTLRRIAERRPNLKVLANDSANFDFGKVMRDLGFWDVQNLRERSPTTLPGGIVATRFPSTGIDNFLLLESSEFRVLNFNDCNLPLRAARRIAAEIGPVDLYLGVYNLAQKHIETSPIDWDELRRQNRQRMLEYVEIFRPRFFVPFASGQYFRAPETAEQNACLMTPEQAVGDAGNGRVVHPGERLRFLSATETITERVDQTVATTPTVVKRVGAAEPDELVRAATGFVRTLNGAFFSLTRLLPPVVIAVEDKATTLRLNFRRGRGEVVTDAQPCIQGHSTALLHWFTNRYGTDTFVVGGHFRILGPALRSFRLLVLATLLNENGMSPLGCLKMALRGRVFGFFWNRREEVAAVIGGGRVKQGVR